ncbi:hypothetical protein PARPLA_02970 [Rhodobacteraceae bacterium THAF1]|uniref:hypothetical protein n=1 Tax=Palleronia sp. THAF1 TaxID=2587842 RepID=UPI000F41A1C2|nr:hypothetical protein [Palleronia sp. THAF1]QFU08371.1 hypothetical protein FIU81_06760 [Palleronia sp. THAF1]VDC29081.1 hypothetical protein PARPLA_02970 [Rhodobacteraceae bacterium THAF1]
MIPRATIAEALEVGADDLPPGDLPIARFAERFLGALASEDEMDAWTVDVFHHLVTAAPDLALAALLTCLEKAPDQAQSLGEGPLTDLLTRSGADVMSGIEAAKRPALTRALQAADISEIEHPFLLARIEAARG